MVPSNPMSILAGTMAEGTSPKAATPAGRERTPEPTQALIRLKVEDFIEAQEEASTLHCKGRRGGGEQGEGLV